MKATPNYLCPLKKIKGEKIKLFLVLFLPF